MLATVTPLMSSDNDGGHARSVLEGAGISGGDAPAGGAVGVAGGGNRGAGLDREPPRGAGGKSRTFAYLVAIYFGSNLVLLLSMLGAFLGLGEYSAGTSLAFLYLVVLVSGAGLIPLVFYRIVKRSEPGGDGLNENVSR